MFEDYKNRMTYRGKNMSEMLRMQSNMVIEQTWDRDPNYRQVYVGKGNSGLPEVTAEHELIDTDMVIADDTGILALAGVIGGARGSTTEKTKNNINMRKY